VSAANVEIARRAFAALARGDVDAVGEVLDANVTWHGGDASAPGACHDRGQALAFIREAARQGRVGELVDVLDAGDQVVAVMRPPQLPGDRPELRANLATFRDGKVVAMVAYESPAAALAAARA
jgi:ketosteroid isomerase-like protein